MVFLLGSPSRLFSHFDPQPLLELRVFPLETLCAVDRGLGSSHRRSTLPQLLLLVGLERLLGGSRLGCLITHVVSVVGLWRVALVLLVLSVLTFLTVRLDVRARPVLGNRPFYFAQNAVEDAVHGHGGLVSSADLVGPGARPRGSRLPVTADLVACTFSINFRGCGVCVWRWVDSLGPAFLGLCSTRGGSSGLAFDRERVIHNLVELIKNVARLRRSIHHVQVLDRKCRDGGDADHSVRACRPSGQSVRRHR